VEWKINQRLTPEQAFSHPFISKAVNELKCLRTGSGSVAAERQPQEFKDETPGNNHNGNNKIALYEKGPGMGTDSANALPSAQNPDAD